MAATSQIKEKFEDYDGFVEKFKPKRTTDDCFTPPAVYEAVRAWVFREYADALTEGGMPVPVVRPFFPGGDYEAADYPAGCVVFDNPPFSILSRIVRFYQARGVKFFLFAPHLTCFQYGGIDGVTIFPLDAKVVYDNGAILNTAFVTNLDPCFAVRSAPDLRRAIEAAQKDDGKKKLPKYGFPRGVLTATMVGKLAARDVDFNLPRGAAYHLPALESMKAAGQKLFGAGFLIPERAADEVAAGLAREIPHGEKVISWELSEQEREIIRGLNYE